jgi:hypothetical protein
MRLPDSDERNDADSPNHALIGTGADCKTEAESGAVGQATTLGSNNRATVADVPKWETPKQSRVGGEVDAGVVEKGPKSLSRNRACLDEIPVLLPQNGTNSALNATVEFASRGV